MIIEAKLNTSSQDASFSNKTCCPATNLQAEQRKALAIDVLAQTQPISHLATKHSVSRKFLYNQAAKASDALDQAFSTKALDQDVLFYLPVTKAWLIQLVLALVLICHSSYRGVIELLHDLFGVDLSVGTIHNTIHSVISTAKKINSEQDLTPIDNGVHDELFQHGKPVLVGIDMYSTYCYLLASEQQRDADSWAVHLLDLTSQGFNPQRIVADGAKGLRAGQQIALPATAFQGDVFHPLYQIGKLTSLLNRRALSSISTVENLQRDINKAKHLNPGNTLSKNLTLALAQQQQNLILAQDISILADWVKNDILALAGPNPSERRELLDFVIIELRAREHLLPHRITPIRRALENQADDLLAFASVLDEQLAVIAHQHNLPIALLYDICQLQALNPSSTAYWQQQTLLCKQLQSRFFDLQLAVLNAISNTPHASSIVENFNGRLRNYFSLRRHIGNDYLALLRFFLNHRTFIRSERPERVGKSPAELLSGQKHPHWLELLGFTLFHSN